MSVDPTQPFLRTLAPLLKGLEKQLRTWLDSRRRYPVTLVQRAEIEGIADDLKRKSEALDVDKPLLIIMLMGGTGVGKSTLMNAFAGDAVAQASFTRPTTRDPVVYFHQSVHPDKLDPALRLCKLVTHNRQELLQKVIVDTPDLDSNDLTNREKLLKVLPVADVVLYVGSQEKYHDQIGWELFKEQRRRRAFAFVLNKWDRCQLDPGTVGLRPDEDLLRDLKSEGFEQPKLFRTQAQAWVEAEKANKSKPDQLPPGEQFEELRSWLEAGLTRLEIEAVKARGVGQLIDHARSSMQAVCPPDLTAEATRVSESWKRILEEEADAQSEVLLNTLEPYQQEVEHHFSVRGQQRFRGLMAGYFRITNKLRYFSTSLKDQVPLASKLRDKGSKSEWDLAMFVEACSHVAEERVLGQRLTALVNRLLVEADQKGFPLQLLNDRTEETAKLNWEERITRCVVESLSEVEAEVTKPTGWRRILRDGVTILGNVLPEIVLIGLIIRLLWGFFIQGIVPDSLLQILLPVYATLAVLILLHLLIVLVLPVRWGAIRGEFQSRLEKKLREELSSTFQPLAIEVAATVNDEKKQVEYLITEIQQVSDWLREREQAAHVSGLYGQ
jgi:GTPase SAR1 family protein